MRRISASRGVAGRAADDVRLHRAVADETRGGQAGLAPRGGVVHGDAPAARELVADDPVVAVARRVPQEEQRRVVVVGFLLVAVPVLHDDAVFVGAVEDVLGGPARRGGGAPGLRLRRGRPRRGGRGGDRLLVL